MKKILEINENPILTTYPEFGVMFSVIDLNNPKSWDWIYSSFIQIYSIEYYKYMTHKGEVYDYIGSISSYREHLELGRYSNNMPAPTLKYLHIDQEFLKNKNNYNIIETIIQAINQGLYISLYLDWYYLPKSPCYQYKHNPHLTLIYGYDLEKRIFYARDNLDNGRYISEEIFFEDFLKSYNIQVTCVSVNNENQQNITFIKRVEAPSYQFNIQYTLEELLFYVNSYNSNKKNISNNSENMAKHFSKHFSFYYNCKLQYYNIGFYENLLNNLLFIKDADELDIRTYHLLYEHKKLMLNRVKYLIDKEFIPSHTIIIDLFENNLKLARIILSVALKLIISKNINKSKKSLEEYINILQQNEIKSMNILINEINSNL
ncbi:cysteine peptidase family C39 domain-containing protein [Anaerocolumna chitinilytica]|uniref:Butirosin biosynthesis protein H N-terminal domain-containing protein n=1 Tax=Anaerocolumna chitinilytica TaxID=1727145 RepID=A0A7M3SA58_9FIRM|nr:hypothetical protein [Anaerocolumna chitinilytica]BCK01476.1 hypothetical protein bsdcttw_45160 [Anaerocolumna chitinilytica]